MPDAHLLGEQDQHETWWEQLGQGPRGGDRAGRQLVVVPECDHGGQRQQTHDDHGGGNDPGGGSEQRADDDDRGCDTPAQWAHQHPDRPK